jgi:hypothetical protein
MQYQVPQFIEIEDKIFGPLTLKQFIYLAGGVGLCLIFFTLLPIYLMLVLGTPVMALSAGLAFYKVNGRPLIVALEHAFSYFVGHKLYLWQQHEAKAEAEKKEAPAPVTQMVPKLSDSRLKDLAWSLNIKDREQTNTNRQGFQI